MCYEQGVSGRCEKTNILANEDGSLIFPLLISYLGEGAGTGTEDSDSNMPRLRPEVETPVTVGVRSYSAASVSIKIDSASDDDSEEESSSEEEDDDEDETTVDESDSHFQPQPALRNGGTAVTLRDGLSYRSNTAFKTDDETDNEQVSQHFFG